MITLKCKEIASAELAQLHSHAAAGKSVIMASSLSPLFSTRSVGGIYGGINSFYFIYVFINQFISVAIQ